MVVFSIAHRDTFDVAVDLLAELLLDIGTDRATILVGNKADLVRKRKVKMEGKIQTYSSKCLYVSKWLNIMKPPSPKCYMTFWDRSYTVTPSIDLTFH